MSALLALGPEPLSEGLHAAASKMQLSAPNDVERFIAGIDARIGPKGQHK